MYAIIQRYGGLTDQWYAIVLRLYLAFSSPFHHVDLAITDLPIADLGFVGVCWWMWMWMWVGGCGFVPISLVVFFFFWWMWVCAGGGCWCCYGNGCCAVVVVVDDDDEDERE